ncbi:MAG: WD40/YVTN/BNR-like repeat-containing protein [Bacteroidota bacterium]
MGKEDLIKRYSIDKMRGRNLFRFLGDVYRSGKTREVISFAVWETLHNLGWFPKSRYLQFSKAEPFALTNEEFAEAGFEEQLRKPFQGQGLDIAPSVQPWKRLFVTDKNQMVGYLDPDDRCLHRSTDGGRTLIPLGCLPGRVKSVFVSSRGTVFASVKGAVYRGGEQGKPFVRAIELGSPESFFRHSYAMTETPEGMLIIGEYGNVWEKGGWRKLANLYLSTDDGITWRKSDFLIRKGTNKHVHIVRYSRLLGRILLCDGDNKKKLWISQPLAASTVEEPRWKPITRLHIQTGGYTSVTESHDRVFFGTDYQGGTNFIVDTQDGRKFRKRIVPDPYRRSPIHNLVARRSKRGDEIWANLPISTGRNKCLLMCSLDGGETWNRMIEYNSKVHSISLIGASNTATDEVYFSVKDRRNNTRVVYRIGDRT